MPTPSEYTTLLPQENVEFPLDSHRYYVLLLFAFLGTQQCYAWYTFGSIPTQTTAYFGLTKDQGDAFADLTMSYGGIILLIVIGPCMWALTGEKGLQLVMRLSAILTFACCLLRSLPCFLYPSDAVERRNLIWLLHLAQILNAAAGATYLSAGSRVSAVWFPPRHRTLATAVAMMGGNLGMMLGYGFGALFSTGEEGLPQLLYLELGISVIPLILVAVHCPLHPDTCIPLDPVVDDKEDNNNNNSTVKNFLKDVYRILHMPSMWFLLLAGGLESGSNAAWGGLLPQIFETRFDSDSADSLANLCGLLNCSGSLIGMLASGWIADTFFQRRLKQLMLIYFGLGAALTICVTTMFPTPWTPVLWSANQWQIAFVMTVAGGFQGCLDPLFLELAAEITYPSKEGTSGGLSIIAMNVAALAVLLLAPVLSAVLMNTVYSFSLVACVILTSCVTQKYLRSEKAQWADS